MNAQPDQITTQTDCNQVYQMATKKWGHELQEKKAIEEFAECITALIHYREGKIPFADLVSEIADATIMCAQLRLIHSASAVDRAVMDKTERLRARLGVDEKRVEALANGEWHHVRNPWRVRI